MSSDRAAADRPPVLLLGAGYTLTRVALRLLATGRVVLATTRRPERLALLAARGARVLPLEATDARTLQALARALPRGAIAVHSIPPLEGPGGPIDPTPALLDPLAPRLARLVTLSSTGVYGAAQVVDATTPVAPAAPLARARVAAEEATRAYVASSLVLRPPAIYGPHRDLHVGLREGRYRLVGDGSTVGSRIHVDDLARHVEAAVDAALVGAFPVADDGPATAAEVVRFCVDLLGLPFPASVASAAAPETLRVTRRVDGRLVRERLGLDLRYPTYREGIPAALAAERSEAGPSPSTDAVQRARPGP